MDEEGDAIIRQQVLDDVEASNTFPKIIMWRNTDFLRHVVGQKRTRKKSNYFHIRL